MLPLCSQRLLSHRDFLQMEPHANLKQNRIKLCSRNYPMMSEIRKHAKPNVDFTLLGGLLPIKSISFKSVSLFEHINCLNVNCTSDFLANLDVMRDVIKDLDYCPPKVIKPGDPHQSYYGNADIGNFKTNFAWIPVWSNDSDLIDTFSTDYELMGNSKTITKNKIAEVKIGRNFKLQRESILGTKRAFQQLLDNDYALAPANGENCKMSEEPTKKRKTLPSFISFYESESGIMKKETTATKSSSCISIHGIQIRHFIPDLLVPIDESTYKSCAGIFPNDLFIRNNPYRDKNYIRTLAPFGNYLCPNRLETSHQIIQEIHQKIHPEKFEKESFLGIIGTELEDLIEMKMMGIKRRENTAEKSDKISLLSDLLLSKSEDVNVADLELDDVNVQNDLKKETYRQVINNQWIGAVQYDNDNNKKRPRFQEVDILLTDSFVDDKKRNEGKYVFDYSTPQFSSALFCSSFFQSDRLLHKKNPYNFQFLSPERSVEVGVKNKENMMIKLSSSSSTSISTSTSTTPFSWISYFKPKPLSLKEKCLNLISMESPNYMNCNDNKSTYQNSSHPHTLNFNNLHQNPDSNYKNNNMKSNMTTDIKNKSKNNINNSSRQNVIDRMLSSTHALRCITINPYRNTNKYCYPFTNSRQSEDIYENFNGQHVQYIPYVNGMYVKHLGSHIIDVIRPQLRDSTKSIREVENKKRGNEKGK